MNFTLRGVHAPQQRAVDVEWRQLSEEGRTLRRRESEHRAARVAARHGRPQHEQEARAAAEQMQLTQQQRPRRAARSTRSFPTYAIAGSDATATESDVGTMGAECPYYHTLMWLDEKIDKLPRNLPGLSICWAKGKVQLLSWLQPP